MGENKKLRNQFISIIQSVLLCVKIVIIKLKMKGKCTKKSNFFHWGSFLINNETENGAFYTFFTVNINFNSNTQTHCRWTA